jgi:hypothetical protein
VKCSVCAEEHDLDHLEPSFARPDDFVALDAEARQGRAQASNDLCRIADEEPPGVRCFVRAVLDVQVLDQGRVMGWGLWAEVAEADFDEIVALWRDPDQDRHPPIRARVANRVPGYPTTIGMPVELRLTGPKTRPKLSVPPDVTHVFGVECRTGVTSHQVYEWLGRASGGAPGTN